MDFPWQFSEASSPRPFVLLLVQCSTVRDRARISPVLMVPHEPCNIAPCMYFYEGMSMDVTTSRQDMAVQLHLNAVTLQDRARPDDSPFRNMIYSMPDETSHGGLIHVTYWASAGGVRRVPPASIAETNQKYDMVVDARFSTLKVGRKGKQRTVHVALLDLENA